MKKIIQNLLLIFFCITLSGCFNNDEMEDINIHTSIYPIEYIANILYGEHAVIKSVFPDGIDTASYKLTKKQIKDYSKSDLFIYNGLSNEKNYAVSMLNYNNKLKIIDTSLGMKYQNNVAELWLDPANFLMMAQNVKKGLEEYITSNYLIKEIKSNYEKLQLSLSEIDADLKSIVSNAKYNTIIVSDNTFKYLEKYNITVISLEENNNLNDKIIDEASSLIKSNKIKYIYTKDTKDVNSTIKNILENNTGVTILPLNSLSTITTKDRSNKEDYISIIQENINQIKRELYK